MARDAISQAERLGRDGDAYLADSAQPAIGVAKPRWADESTMALPVTELYADDE